jgi:hypothetical protein
VTLQEHSPIAGFSVPEAWVSGTTWYLDISLLIQTWNQVEKSSLIFKTGGTRTLQKSLLTMLPHTPAPQKKKNQRKQKGAFQGYKN